MTETQEQLAKTCFEKFSELVLESGAAKRADIATWPDIPPRIREVWYDLYAWIRSYNQGDDYAYNPMPDLCLVVSYIGGRTNIIAESEAYQARDRIWEYAKRQTANRQEAPDQGNDLRMGREAEEAGS